MAELDDVDAAALYAVPGWTVRRRSHLLWTRQLGAEVNGKRTIGCPTTELRLPQRIERSAAVDLDALESADGQSEADDAGKADGRACPAR